MALPNNLNLKDFNWTHQQNISKTFSHEIVLHQKISRDYQLGYRHSIWSAGKKLRCCLWLFASFWCISLWSKNFKNWFRYVKVLYVWVQVRKFSTLNLVFEFFFLHQANFAQIFNFLGGFVEFICISFLLIKKY